MSVSIPTAGGVPGISGPPDWLSGGAGQSFHLDDVRWRGATKQTFTAGAFNGIFFRAIHGSFVGQEYLFLTFRAGFVPDMNFQRDFVYLGLQKHGTTDAIVIRIQVHDSMFAIAGETVAPANAFTVQVKKSTGGGAWNIIGNPTWVDVPAQGIRCWTNPNTNVADPNFRWGVQMRIPMQNAGTIDGNAGPNLATDYDMWYVMRGSVGGNPTILAEYRTDGGSISALNLNNGVYPLPAGIWDEFQSTAGPATFGGVSIEGNWSNDVVVQNGLGTTQTIQNGQPNAFIARPRNYRPAGAGNDIAAGDIAATFRIANWGSVGGNPSQVDWATGVWDYLPSNDENHPVISGSVIPTLAANTAPPATSPIKLGPVVMNLGANKSLHQCILVTLSSPNVAMNFLQDSVFQNMNYDHASILEREAEISIVGLKPFSNAPRDVYLALEKINMQASTPGADEGQFLTQTMDRLMEQGGDLAGKLKVARRRLNDPDRGDFGSSARLQALLDQLRATLGGTATLLASGPGGSIITELANWLPPLKKNKNAANAASDALRRLASWLTEPGNSSAKLGSFKTAFRQWLAGVNNDPATLNSFPQVLAAIRQYIDGRFQGSSSAQQLARAIDQLLQWFNSNRLPADLTNAVDAIGNALQPFTSANNPLKTGVGTFVYGVARWLVGSERLQTMVEELVSAGVTEAEMDNIFPTFRVHVYHDTGERVVENGETRPVLRAQSTFGLYAYHEGTLEGWQTSIQGAQRITDNLYLLAVPNDGAAKITTIVQAVEKGQERIPEDPIRPRPPVEQPGCLARLLKLLGLGK